LAPLRCVVIIIAVAVRASAAPPFNGAKEFLQKNCAACHNGTAPKARLDLTKFAYDPANPDNFTTCVKVHDRVSGGEKPPTGMPLPDAALAKQFISGLPLRRTNNPPSPNAGAGLRCLNAYDYENAIRDLLSIPWVQLKEKLPQDGIPNRFNKTGTVLDVSHIQRSRYMSSADYALREAIASKLTLAEPTVTKSYARQESSLARNFWGREGSTRADRINFPVLDSRRQADVRAGRAPVSNPEIKEREAIGRVSSIFSDAGGFSWSTFRAPTAGR
jgi:hypothetical protein